VALSNSTITFTTATVTTPFTFTNTTVTGGVVNIPSGESFKIVGGTLGANINIQGGVLSIEGSVALTGALTTAGGSTLRVEGTPTYGAAALTVANGFTNVSGATIQLSDAIGAFGATLTITNGQLINASGATFSVSGGAGGPRILAAELNNQSTINIATSQGLTLTKPSAVHTNSGTISLTGGNLTVTQSGAGATFVNASSGTINLSNSRSLVLTGGALDLSQGLVAGAGTLDVNNSTMTFTTATVTSLLRVNNTAVNGGTVNILSGQALNLVGASTLGGQVNVQGTLFVQGAVTLSGTVTTTSNSMIRVQGNSTYGAGALTTTNGFTNNLGSTIELTDVVGAFGATLTITNGTLTNAVGATFNVAAGAGGPRTLAAKLDNQSTITIAASQGLTLSKASASHENTGTINLTGGNLMLVQSGTAPSFSNFGTVAISNGRSLVVTGGTYDSGDGFTSGAGVLDMSNADLGYLASLVTTPMRLVSTTVNGGTVVVPSGRTITLVGGSTLGGQLDLQGTLLVNGAVALTGQLNTNVGAVVRVEGNNVYGAGALTTTNGFNLTQGALLELTDAVGAFGASVAVTNGTLSTSSGSDINILQGAGGPRTITAQLSNLGTITISGSQGLTINKPSAQHLNRGTLAVSGGNLVLAQSGTSPSFSNEATVSVSGGRTWTTTGGTVTNVSGTFVGIISGAGTLDMSGTTFTNNAILRPGGSTTAGILNYTGTYTSTSSSTLNIELGGTTAGSGYDRLAIVGSPTLSGTLVVTLINGFSAFQGQTFDVVTHTGPLTGNFSGVSLPTSMASAGCTAAPVANAYRIFCP
jgi:fibronectin-binding autotransporter adhesin